eukprot:m.236667 g.236667  ORF g.236667 m.236667 type:complete len:325 (-) comp18942_c2_seq1:183-1157(-)
MPQTGSATKRRRTTSEPRSAERVQQPPPRAAPPTVAFVGGCMVIREDADTSYAVVPVGGALFFVGELMVSTEAGCVSVLGYRLDVGDSRPVHALTISSLPGIHAVPPDAAASAAAGAPTPTSPAGPAIWAKHRRAFCTQRAVKLENTAVVRLTTLFSAARTSITAVPAYRSVFGGGADDSSGGVAAFLPCSAQPAPPELPTFAAPKAWSAFAETWVAAAEKAGATKHASTSNDSAVVADGPDGPDGPAAAAAAGEGNGVGASAVRASPMPTASPLVCRRRRVRTTSECDTAASGPSPERRTSDVAAQETPNHERTGRHHRRDSL